MSNNCRLDIYVIIAKKRDQVKCNRMVYRFLSNKWKTNGHVLGGAKAFEGTFNQPFRNELQKLLLSPK